MVETLDELDRRHGDEMRAEQWQAAPSLAMRHKEERKRLLAHIEAEEREKDKTRPKKNLRERMGLFWNRRCIHCGQGDTFPNVGTCGWFALTKRNPGGGDPPCLSYGDNDRSRVEQRERLRVVWARWAVAGAIAIIALSFLDGWFFGW